MLVAVAQADKLVTHVDLMAVIVSLILLLPKVEVEVEHIQLLVKVLQVAQVAEEATLIK